MSFGMTNTPLPKDRDIDQDQFLTILSREDALAFASIVVDLRVTQVVNGALGVHAVLRDDAFL